MSWHVFKVAQQNIADNKCLVNPCRYAWSHIETKQGLKAGEQLWQLAFGSGDSSAGHAVPVTMPKNAILDAIAEPLCVESSGITFITAIHVWGTPRMRSQADKTA